MKSVARSSFHKNLRLVSPLLLLLFVAIQLGLLQTPALATAWLDDKDIQGYSFRVMTNMLDALVLIYLLLAGLMALMVLLNLDVMFVIEKKRELIVLMICGFTNKAAKAYIYRDSIVLTAVGIVLGIVAGTVMGGLTIFALEPDSAYWIKGFSPLAALVGAVGAGVFAAAMLIWSLRQIDKFELTDISRF